MTIQKIKEIRNAYKFVKNLILASQNLNKLYLRNLYHEDFINDFDDGIPDIIEPINITLQQLFYGCTINKTFEQYSKCSNCNGSGLIDSEALRCNNCDGSGSLVDIIDDMKIIILKNK